MAEPEAHWVGKLLPLRVGVKGTSLARGEKLDASGRKAD